MWCRVLCGLNGHGYALALSIGPANSLDGQSMTSMVCNPEDALRHGVTRESRQRPAFNLAQDEGFRASSGSALTRQQPSLSSPRPAQAWV